MLANHRQTTPTLRPSVEIATVTHPYHPLFGQQVEIVGFRHGRDLDLIIRLPDGNYGAISASFTDHLNSTQLHLDPSNQAPQIFLDLKGLQLMADLLDRIRIRGLSSNKT